MLINEVIETDDMRREGRRLRERERKKEREGRQKEREREILTHQ